MTLNYGGEQHLVLFNFKCQSVSTFDADKHEIDDTRYAHFKKTTCHVGLQSKVSRVSNKSATGFERNNSGYPSRRELIAAVVVSMQYLHSHALTQVSKGAVLLSLLTLFRFSYQKV